MTKQELRKVYLSKRVSLSKEIQEELNKKMTEHFDKIYLSEIAFAMSYFAIATKGEIPPVPMEKVIKKQHPQCRLCYPKTISATCSIEAILYEDGMTITTGEFGISELVSDKIVNPQQLDVILVPLLAFEGKGYRVGYGKGFYDRFIARCRPDVITIGLSFFEPVETITDIDEYDMPLQYCVTPEQLYQFK